jgi:hypothetical protein
MEKRKKLKERRRNIIYIDDLGYLHCLHGLGKFKKSQPVVDPYYLFIYYVFYLILSIISILTNFDKLGQII